MASVFDRGGCWYLRFKDELGRWRQVASKARTKTEARRLADAKEQRAEKVRAGLLPTDRDGMTVKEVLEWHRTTYLRGLPSHDTVERSVRLHLLPDLGSMPLAQLRPAHLETLLQQKASVLSPQSLNHLRGYLSRAINKAKKAGLWAGENIAASVETRRVARRQYDYLRADEVPRLLAALGLEHRSLFATAIFTGLRKGELLALRKSDVDLGTKLLTVARSYGRDTTKGGHADVIPIASEAVPYLQAAMEASPSDLVFPNEAGEMRRPDFKAQAILRRALGRAGIVSGWTLVCRRKGCAFRREAATAEDARCPQCTMRLWPKAKTRPLRFHDLRGTCASLLIQSGASAAAVAAVLRHSDPNLTLRRYAHMSPAFLRQEIDRLSFGTPVVEDDRVRALASGNAEPFAALVLHDDMDPGQTKAGGTQFPEAPPAFALERRKGFEPSTPSLGSSCSTN